MTTRRLKPWEFTNPACAGEGTSPFYSTDPDDPDVEEPTADYTEAKRICAMCMHQDDCAEWGINNEVHGVWGGLDPEERRKLKRRQSRMRSRNSLVLA